MLPARGSKICFVDRVLISANACRRRVDMRDRGCQGFPCASHWRISTRGLLGVVAKRQKGRREGGRGGPSVQCPACTPYHQTSYLVSWWGWVGKAKVRGHSRFGGGLGGMAVSRSVICGVVAVWGKRGLRDWRERDLQRRRPISMKLSGVPCELGLSACLSCSCSYRLTMTRQDAHRRRGVQ